MVRASLIAAFLMSSLTGAEAVEDMTICYILDGILILYGIILTVLYCRLRKQPADGGIYAGLTTRNADTYETLQVKKKPAIV
ncbi:High affinity immunoglobulin epsilon receptor subunit gamma Fc receptor gamma-chain [Channa argus]|nr:High affinity immunoglobulin epsilon receptor subunit gamma Fc receptor gamma-chain [Channa argus]